MRNPLMDGMTGRSVFSLSSSVDLGRYHQTYHRAENDGLLRRLLHGAAPVDVHNEDKTAPRMSPLRTTVDNDDTRESWIHSAEENGVHRHFK